MCRGERQRRNIEAFYDPQSGKVHLIAERITPSRAAKVAFHEVAVHKGLRDAMGDHFDLFIEKVQQDFADEIEAFRNSDAGQQYSFADDRELAEEWLAHIGETLVDAKDRSLLGRLVDALRRFLRKIPKFARLRYTQGELEGMILAAAKNVRNGSRRFNAPGVAEQNGQQNAKFSTAPVIEVAALPVDITDTASIRNFLYEHFKGKEVEIKSDGRLVLFTTEGLKGTLKRRGEHRNAFSALDAIVEKSYPVGYEAVDNRHKANRPDLRGQFVYAALLDFGQAEKYIATIKLDDTATDKRALFKDISIKKRSLYAGQTQNSTSGNASLPADPNITIQQLVDFVKSDFSDTPLFTDKMPQKNNLRLSVAPVWTGTAADYDQPSLQYIGTGEGAQAYGWGLYGSNDRVIGEWYAQADVKRKYEPHLLLDGHKIYYGHSDVTDNVLYVLGRWDVADIDDAEEYLQNQIDSDGYGGDYYEETLSWLRKNRDKITFVPRKQGKAYRHLYKQIFWPGKEENLLDWDKPLTEKQVQQIAEQGKKENLPFVYEENGKLFFNESTDSGKWVYENLSKPYNGLGSPKAVSEFLYRAGIDGITYIGGSSGVRNYVAFSDKDIRVDEHIRFSMRTDETWKEMADKLATRIMPVIRDHTATISLAEEIKTLLLEEGFLLEDAEVDEIIVKAKDMLRSWQTRLRARQDLAYIYETDPWLNAIAAVYGDNFRIVPGEKYRGEEFDGTWINNKKNGISKGIRTPVDGMRTRCPRPLDDGDATALWHIKYCGFAESQIFSLNFSVKS